MVIQQLQKDLMSVKDSINHYYKSIICLIDINKNTNSIIFKRFGYKCKLIRDPLHNCFQMEILVPIELEKGIKKVHLWEKLIRQIDKKTVELEM